MGIKNKLKLFVKRLVYKRGLKTNRKIVVFESDDWGAVRVPNKESLDKFTAKNPDIVLDHYQTYDGLETTEDIERLKTVLLSHMDSKNKNCIFTLNFALGNPDFDKIRKEKYNAFYWESIETTYKNHKKSAKVLQSVKDGITKSCLMPQLHSREHLNSFYLLNDIKENKPIVTSGFDLNIVGISEGNYMGLDTLNTNNMQLNSEILTDATKEFKRVFGFTSSTFIAPCYVWDKNDEIVLKKNGITSLQGKIYQNIAIARDKYKKQLHKFGEKSKYSNLHYFIRNCFFEPSKDIFINKSDTQIINDILKQIEFAFKCNKPAVICSHRVNYTSAISIENRDRNLQLLDKLLTELEKIYTDIEYMSTDKMHETLTKN